MNMVQEVMQLATALQASGQPSIIWLSKYQGGGLYDRTALLQHQQTADLSDSDRVQLQQILTSGFPRTVIMQNKYYAGEQTHWWYPTTLGSVAWHDASLVWECAGCESHFLVVNLPLGDFQDANQLPGVIKEILSRVVSDPIEADSRDRDVRGKTDLLLRLSERQHVNPSIIGTIEHLRKEARLATLLNGYLLWYLFEHQGEPDQILPELGQLADELHVENPLVASYFRTGAFRLIDRMKAHLNYQAPYPWCPAEIYGNAPERFEENIVKIQGWLRRGVSSPILDRQLAEVAGEFRRHFKRGHSCPGKKKEPFFRKLFR